MLKLFANKFRRTTDPALTLADQHAKTGEWAAAIAILAPVVAADTAGSLTGSYALLARCYRRIQRLKDAERIVALGLARCGQDQSLLIEKADLATATDDPRAALMELACLDNTNGKLPARAFATRVTAHLALNQFSDAAEAAARAVASHPNNIKLKILQARAEIGRADFAKASGILSSVESKRGDLPEVARLQAICVAQYNPAELRALVSDMVADKDWLKLVDTLMPTFKAGNLKRAEHFNHLARGLSKLGRHDEGLEVLDRALAVCGRTIGLAAARADFLGFSFRHDEATAAWYELLAEFGDACPPTVYIRFAEYHRRQRAFDEALDIAGRGIARFPDHLNLNAEVVHIYHARGDWQTAVDRARAFMPALGTLPALDATLADCRLNIASEQADTAYRQLRHRAPRRAAESFASALADSGIIASADAWSRAFGALTDIMLKTRGKWGGALTAANTAALPKLLVAGTGWSGSGALYDFFREFEVVRALHGEFRHIEHSTGFRAFTNNTPVETAAFNLFAKATLGLGAIEGASDLVAMHTARWFSLLDNPQYADAVADVLRALHAAREPASDEQLLRQTNRLIDTMIAISCSAESPVGRVHLLDNVIHCQNVDLLPFISNYHYFAVFRDPRSQYAANCAENRNFDPDVKRFIRNYVAYRQAFVRKVDNIAPGHGQVRIVQFEDFVTSEDYRMELAGAFVGDCVHHRHRHFNPAISIRNVTLHEKHLDQAAIAYITEQLPEFLWSGPNH